ncbi:Holliday junction branch migration DNA helicase RuvB [Mycoplasmopsis cynos]|uniref:Holliday junction branch migration complex subunit RuvB n=2 Tax=Mycoplasmopsis cynos TaxID=171284 RepID=L0RUI1_MYCC1|nr:Holliday junction branch migration DNA helicase RuvB [Mycoplasmopsis cynos]MCU9934865.1 Holliday junction branch migration DNA helicase RuvB [Mycoplasmopsis cynos]TQC54678.1 Holliday junction branch migration DNA helicase RuvB [Mycoplasmopsis cynos]WAM05635.1 Holliday junction branch migration DNA helicase RuvB [Mycoplasmopsis cynos]WQQ13482.1 Holliday junction branch migration DNA helicase RuvB [Mycoplasmopsis cynos]WQQ13757.1 Holliday junction branch migration DNA helicase RuvB [Mycoplasm
MQLTELRPSSFKEFIGQENLKKTLKAMIDSAKQQKKILSHLLFYGLPGMGKTTLVSLIGSEMNKKIHFIQGTNIERKSDLINVLSVINEGDIVFIDEIHSINKTVVEFLYNAMEDFVFDLIIGVEGNSRPMRMKIKPFTLIGATTKINEISQPLKDRFGYIGRLINYNDVEIFKILKNTAKRLNIDINDECIEKIVSYSRKTPRIANHLLQRVNDFAISLNEGKINLKTIKKTFKCMDLYEYGLSKDHIEYLEILKEAFFEKYASLFTLTGLARFAKEDILTEIEPILLFYELIEKTSRGRRISSKGLDYLIRQNLFSK